MQQIQGKHTILAASDCSYLEDGRAAAGRAFYVLRIEINDNGRRNSGIKVLFGWTILVEGCCEAEQNTENKHLKMPMMTMKDELQT